MLRGYMLAPESPIRFTEELLDNGLGLVLVEVPHLHQTTISVFSRVGSRHESPETNGLSHFLEHMFFRGCDGFESARALNVAMEDLGGFLDGYTTRDYTAYQSTVHPSGVADAIGLYGRMFQSPSFQELDVERSIILEELLDSLDERGRDLDVDNLIHSLHFGGHPLGQTIDGPRRNLRRFQEADLRQHRERFYGARNMLLTVVGAFEPDKAREAAKNAFLQQFEGVANTDGVPPEPPSGPQIQFRSSDEAQTRLRLSFRACSATDPSYPALSLLRRVLDGGLSSLLQVELVEKRGIVYEIGADLEAYSDTGLFSIELAVGHKKLPTAIEELGRVLRQLKESPIDPVELESIKRRAMMTVEFGMDSPLDLTALYGIPRLFGSKDTPEERLSVLNRVSAEEVEAAAKQCLCGSGMSAVAVGGAPREVVTESKRRLRELAQALGA